MKKMKKEEMATIELLAEKGLTPQEITTVTGWGDAVIRYVIRFVKYAKNGQYDKLEAQKKNHEPLVEYCYEKYPPKEELKEDPIYVPAQNNDNIVITLLGELLTEIRETNALLRAIK